MNRTKPNITTDVSRMIVEWVQWLNGISAICTRFGQTDRTRAVDSLLVENQELINRLYEQKRQLSQILEEKKVVYPSGICFTLDRYLYLTGDPCRVCQYTLKSGNENPCVDCVDLEWIYGDPLPEHFKLHEVLK